MNAKDDTKRGIKEIFSAENVTRFVLENKALVIFIFLALIMSFASKYFLTSENILNVLRQASITAVLAAGFTLMLGSGNIDLSIGAILGLVGILMAMLSKAGMPLPLVFIIGILIGSVFGIFNALIITTFKLHSFIVTLATASIFRGISFVITKLIPVSGISSSFIHIGQGYIGPIPIPICIVVIVGIIMYILISRNMFGRHAIAMGGNIDAARAVGININLVRIGVFATMGINVAIAAIIMTGRIGSAQLSAGQGMELDVIAAVVIGGTNIWGGSANVLGSIVGALLISTVNNILNLLGVDPNWQSISKGLLILIAVILDTTSTRIINRMQKKSKI